MDWQNYGKQSSVGMLHFERRHVAAKLLEEEKLAEVAWCSGASGMTLKIC